VDNVVKLLDQVVILGSKSNVEKLEGKDFEDFLTSCVGSVAKFLDGILVGGHGETFLERKGLEQLLQMLSFPNLPPSFPSTTAMKDIVVVFYDLIIQGCPILKPFTEHLR
jgi:hypothetical protein